MYFYINFFRDSYDSWSKNSLSFIVKQLCGYILYKTQIFFVLYYLNLRGFSWIRNFYKSVTSKKSHVFIVNKIRIYCTSLDYSKVIRREIKCFIIPQDSYTHTSVLCVLQLCMWCIDDFCYLFLYSETRSKTSRSVVRAMPIFNLHVIFAR